MQVNLNNNAGPIQRPTAKAAELRQKPGVAEPDTSFEASEALDVSLSQTPEVRPEVVERARQLISDTHYPPVVAIKKISQLLAMNLQESADVPGSSEAR